MFQMLKKNKSFVCMCNDYDTICECCVLQILKSFDNVLDY